MSGFKALNIESDDESDVEIDDTKEIQIEEALKLYQTALKLHAQGPEFFDQAADAYRELFLSEIFRYPESQAELQRIELYGSATDNDGFWDDVALPDAVALPAISLDTGPSTLPQILHLSHKNYAQFKLDALAARFVTFQLTLRQVLAEASAALDDFVQALDKDETDLDLWRRTASVGEMLDSKRIARYCLESVLDGDGEGLEGVWSTPGLDEGLATEQLRKLVGRLQDRLSLLQNPLSAPKRKILSSVLKQQLHPYQDILDKEDFLRSQTQASPTPTYPPRISFQPPKTWAEMGEILQRQHLVEQAGSSASLPAPIITFALDDTQGRPTTTTESFTTATSSAELSVEPSHSPLPVTLVEQFPGLNNGLPTVQPFIASADESMDISRLSLGDQDTGVADVSTTTLPSRKRSGDAAGINDGVEEGRTKSRRTRARDSNADASDSRQALIDANTRWEYEQQLNEIQAADDWMFETIGNLFERIGIVGFDAARNVRQHMQSSGSSSPGNSLAHNASALRVAQNDLQSFLDHYNEQQAHLLLHGGETVDLGQSSHAMGAIELLSGNGSSKSTSKVPMMPDEDLQLLIRTINSDESLIQEAAWKYIEALLCPSKLESESSYLRYKWPDNLKTMVVRTLVNFDDVFLSKVTNQLTDIANMTHEEGEHTEFELLAATAEAIFELHLDIFRLIKEPNSGVDVDTVLAQGDRLQRWFHVARECMHFRSRETYMSDLMKDDLNLRYLWAVTFHIGATTDAGQEYVIECMTDLREVMVAAGEPVMYLQNNAIMPELSVNALDNEITRLTTRDFFLKVTSQSLRDPLADIENLEPLLQALDVQQYRTSEPNSENFSPELVKFLESSAVSVKLLLWQRLRKAYSDIDYQPMVVWCCFRMIRLILEELKTEESAHLSQGERQANILKSLRMIQIMIQSIWDAVQTSLTALQCIDAYMLKLAVNSLAEVLQLVQVFNVAEDSIRVGQAQAPALPNGLTVPSFTTMSTMLHGLQLHIWMILYQLLKDAFSQYQEVYTTTDEDRFDFLRTVHRNFGIRGICGEHNRVFIRMLKDEFFQLTHIDGYDSEQAQVLYDLYGLNCFLNPAYELIEHHCVHDAFLDRSVAMQAVDLLLAQASKIPIRDLVKHTIKDTIEKVHGAISKKKPTEAILRNRDIYRAFLRGPVQPLDLFCSLRGEGNQLSVSIIPAEDAPLASKGWYFLMGQIALTRFRSQKRTAPSPTEDLEIAIAFFMQDLEATMEHWETWFRLAQAYDSKVEENAVWSAEKLNNNMQELVQFQRSAIHCYTMAMALAYRSADVTHETRSKMTELYADFAMRLYSSSREPFSMLPFAADESTERFKSMSFGLTKVKSFRPISVYTVWKLANTLFKRAIAGEPNPWLLHYMVGKCLWKMHSAPADIRRRYDVPPDGVQVIEAFVRALELLPDKEKKESRDTKREPILEPHYKLVVMVHKLLVRGSISLQQAEKALSHTQHARREDLFPSDIGEWTPYILRVLKNLRIADKSNWYHRMIARSAHIIYGNYESLATDSGEHIGATGAKHELTQQMFTKTMVLQVWRPESERAGRHFVYTARYTRFFVQILKILKDRSSLEALARRVRRRPHDVFEHSSVWQEICLAYLQLLREYAALPDGLETSTFSNIAHEEFLIRKDPLEQWMQVTGDGESPALDVLREVQELKKINQSLMKPGAIDDLIGDSYAHLFGSIGKRLFEDERRTKQEEQAKRPPLPSSPERPSVMNLSNLMNLDGAVDHLPVSVVTPALNNEQVAPAARRKIGVGRREIRTAAEGCSYKPGAQSGTLTSDRAIGLAPRTVQVLNERVRGPRLNSPAENGDNSAPGSVHDSADDESELSELEEEEGEEDVVDETEVEAAAA